MKPWLKVFVVLVGVALLGVLIWMLSRPENGTGGEHEIVVLSFGGEFGDAQKAAYYGPFAKETGTKVVQASYNGEYGKLKAAVESGNVPWNVVDIESSALLRGIEDKILVPIDYEVLNVEGVVPEALHKFAVGADIYSVSLGFNTEKFPTGSPQPNTWADFWDVDRFPGARTMKKDPRFTLEIALIADGVPLTEVYANGELDVERAFASLDRIKPHVAVWWTTGQQPIQLLKDGEVAMAAAFGARIFIAQNKDKAPVQVVWNEGILDMEYWAVLKGAEHKELAFKFIDFASRPKQQAAFSTLFPLGPVNQKAFDHMPKDVASQLNTYPENYKKQLLFNAEFWAKHEADIRERFNEWLGE